MSEINISICDKCSAYECKDEQCEIGNEFKKLKQDLCLAKTNLLNSETFIEEYKKQLQQLEQENEKLKEQVRFKNQFRDYAHKYKQCLDEIEEIVTKYRVADSNLFMSMDIPNVRKISELIKQTKEGE